MRKIIYTVCFVSIIFSCQEEEIFTVVESMPRFYDASCELNFSEGDELNQCWQEALFEFIDDNLEMPQEAIENNVDGSLMIKFIIRPNGYVSDIDFTHTLGYGCEEEAERVILLSNAGDPIWIPGQLEDGEKVPVYFIFPIRFKI